VKRFSGLGAPSVPGFPLLRQLQMSDAFFFTRVPLLSPKAAFFLPLPPPPPSLFLGKNSCLRHFSAPPSKFRAHVARRNSSLFLQEQRHVEPPDRAVLTLFELFFRIFVHAQSFSVGNLSSVFPFFHFMGGSGALPRLFRVFTF